jgi:DNA-binding response OmpR family regulator
MSAPLRVLIVEDEALLAMELEALVEEAGHTVVGWAVSSREALALLDTTEADLAFVDVHLADGPTGIEVAERMRAQRGLTVVFLTANPKRLPENLAGAAGVIAKPYSLSGLNAALRYLHEGVRRPPPRQPRPTGFALGPDYEMRWGA